MSFLAVPCTKSEMAASSGTADGKMAQSFLNITQTHTQHSWTCCHVRNTTD